MNLSDFEEDPKNLLYKEQVNNIMQEWREDFLATDRTQFLLARDKDRLGEETSGKLSNSPPLVHTCTETSD